jgi:hypothetical protein
MIDHLDHLVLTTTDETACVDFYTRVMGMQLDSFLAGSPPSARKAFRFGNQKINLQVISSFYQANDFISVRKNDYYQFFSLPIALRQLCYHIIEAHAIDPMESNRWPGGKAPRMTLGG